MLDKVLLGQKDQSSVPGVFQERAPTQTISATGNTLVLIAA